MKSKLETKKRRNFIITIISYVISGLLAAFGLSLIITSIIGDYLGSGNPIRNAEAATPNIFGTNMSWRYYGLIVLVIAVVILVITIYLNTKKADADEKLEKTRGNRTSLNLENIENNKQ